MKRTVKLFVCTVIIIVITAIAGITASASDYKPQADALNEMGLFRGTDNGYELERIPTRAEAAVMLVRLLGRETEAKAGTYDMPFTDVPDWAKHEVGYLYANSLAKGTTPTTYSPNDTCTAQMFATFLLRALGYSDSGGDFTYSGALEYAVSVGLIEDAATFYDFTRDEMAAMSYSALFQTMKDSGGATLLEKLVTENAVNAAAADDYMASYQNYRSLSDAYAGYASATSMQLSNNTQMQLNMKGQVLTISQESDIAVALKGNDLKLRMDSTASQLGLTQKMTIYYADGWLYMDAGGLKIKSQSVIDTDELAGMTGQPGLEEASEPFYLIESITKTETATGVSYKVVYSATAVNEMLESLLSQALRGSDSAININSLETVYTLDKSGNLKSILVSGDIGLTVSDGQETASAGMTLRSETIIIATGDEVTVSPPADLGSYITQ